MAMMIPDLEAMIRARQDELRGRLMTRLERISERIRSIPWGHIAYGTFLIAVATGYVGLIVTLAIRLIRIK